MGRQTIWDANSHGLNNYEFENFTRVKSMEVGKRYLVSSVEAVSPLQEGGGIYPWGDRRTKIPVECIGETPYFYTVKVLSHYAHCANFGKSYPYKVSLMKKDMMLNGTKIYETEGDLECLEDREMEYTAEYFDLSLFTPSLGG